MNLNQLALFMNNKILLPSRCQDFSKSKLSCLDDVAGGGLNYTDYPYSMVYPKFCYQKAIESLLSATVHQAVIF